MARAAACRSTRHSAIRQPNRSVSSASSGRKTSCPVARAGRQHADDQAAPLRRTSASPRSHPAPGRSCPVPRPTTMPHSRMSCHTSVIASEPTSAGHDQQQGRADDAATPKRFMNAAANGPIRPNSNEADRQGRGDLGGSASRTRCCSGTIMTPGAPTAPAVDQHGQEGRRRRRPSHSGCSSPRGPRRGAWRSCWASLGCRGLHLGQRARCASPLPNETLARPTSWRITNRSSGRMPAEATKRSLRSRSSSFLTSSERPRRT